MEHQEMISYRDTVLPLIRLEEKFGFPLSGSQLVTILAEDQLHGEIKLDRTKGTCFKIKLKAKQ